MDDRQFTERAERILVNMALERRGWRGFFRRWHIHHEPGGYRIVSRWDKAVDIEWHYRITQSPFGKQPLIVQVYKVVGDCLHTGRLLTKKHWSGPLSHFLINQGTIESREEVYA